MPTEDLLSSRQVQAMLGVSKRTLQNYRYQGKIAAIPLGYRTYRYRPAEIRRFLKERENDAKAKAATREPSALARAADIQR